MTKNQLRRAFAGMFFAAAISCSLPAAAKLYKWVDDNGVTHYGETVPPEYADKDRMELNRTGRVVDKREGLTPEEARAERANREQEEARKRQEAQEALEKKRHDRALIDTYSSTSEIELARKRNLQQIELRINGINANLKIAGDSLLGLQKEADTYSKSNKAIPQSLQEDMQEAQSRQDKLKKDLEKLQQERAAVNARYDADKARYKELTGR